MNKKYALLIALAGSIALSSAARASYDALDNQAFNFFDSSNGWTLLTDNDGYTSPGTGGQRFDTEYLFYKYDETSNDLSIGLQTGFDVRDGHVRWEGDDYYTGDLALSFDGDTSGSNGSGYEYAVDFGFLTRNHDGNLVEDGNDGDGIDASGLYLVSAWDNETLHSASSPFAMDEGTLVEAINFTKDNDKFNTQAVMGDNSYGRGFTDGVNDVGWDQSYFRTITFNLDNVIHDASSFTVDAHWTMSCGNDLINGSVLIASNDNPVPEPMSLALFGIGSLGLFAFRKRRSRVI